MKKRNLGMNCMSDFANNNLITNSAAIKSHSYLHNVIAFTYPRNWIAFWFSISFSFLKKKCELVALWGCPFNFLSKAQTKNKLLVNSSHLLRYPYSENTTLTSTYEGGWSPPKRVQNSRINSAMAKHYTTLWRNVFRKTWKSYN